MSEENVEIVRRALAAWNSLNLRAALALVDPNIEVEFAMNAPLDGIYHGHEGLIKVMSEFWGVFDPDTIRSELADLIDGGDEDVVLSVHHRGTGRGSGVPVEMSHWQVCTVRNGKVVRWRNFRTRDQALEAAGLSE
jgi:ketosteroid isomerase-like protein